MIGDKSKIAAGSSHKEVPMTYALQARLLELANMIDNVHSRQDKQASSAVRAIFSGASDAELAAAASWLVATLGVRLQRFDLAVFYDRLRGDSENYLERLLTQAESDQAILMLDGADALFDRRTAALQGRERHLQLDVAYFMEVLAHHNVPVILDSRAYFCLDEALLRHFACVIDFADGRMPVAVEA